MDNGRKRRWILAPCSAYDIEGTESWLREMARKGWQLSEEGFFCGFGGFDKTSPKQTEFRLSADVQKKTPLDGNYQPDEELLDYSRMCGWEYVAKRGDFYIWRSDCPNRRELDTDPQVKAMALDGIRKRQRSNAISILIWCLVYPLAKLRGGIFLSMVNLGTGFVVWGIMLALWFFCVSCAKAVRLNRMRKAILGGTMLRTERTRIRYYLPLAARWILMAAWIFVGMFRVADYVTGDGEIPLKEFTGSPPFATVADFAGAEGTDYKLLNYGYSNKVRQWEDWLAPVNYDWNEVASVTSLEGEKLEGILYLEYNEVRFPWVAKRIAREYWLNDRWKKGYEEMDALELGADFCIAYRDNIHTPTVVICVGNRVVRASFRTYAYSSQVPITTWAKILAESLKNGT